MPVYVSGAAYFNRGFDAAMVREDLSSQNEPRQLSALYQVTAYMMMGKDMSSLFNEVSALTSSTSPTMKRLAYFYLIENSRIQPERTVLQAGTLVKDTLHDSPLVRGAGLRAMTNIQLPMMADFHSGPLHRCLEDSSAYVRRIAAMGVLKQYVAASNVSAESDILDKFTTLLQDSNAAVVAVAVRAMLELQYRNAPVSYIGAILNARSHLIALLPEGSEWTKVYLLEGIALHMMWECHEAVYELHPTSGDGNALSRRQTSTVSSQTSRGAAESTTAALQRQLTGAANDEASEFDHHRDAYLTAGEETLALVMPLLQYASPVVVLSVVRAVALFLHSIHEPRLHVPEGTQRRLMDRYAAPLIQSLVVLLEAPRFEMRYVMLRNVRQFLTPVFAPFFSAHLSKFLVKFEDPIYIKMEKLNLLVRLANNENGSRVLGELMVYAREADAELVRTAVNAIGALATMLPGLSTECVRQLGTLIATRVPRLVENTVVVVQMVLRCYPGKFTEILRPLCDSLTILEATEARAAVAWVLGEYPNSVSDAVTEYLSVLVNQFMEQPRLVQYATMTALAKLYLHGAKANAPQRTAATTEALAMLEKVLGDCTNSYFPDLRDRALFYWRVIALDIDVAKRVMAATEGAKLNASLWDELGFHAALHSSTGNGGGGGGGGGNLHDLGSLASVAAQPLRLLLGDAVIGNSTKNLTGVDDDDDDENVEEAADAVAAAATVKGPVSSSGGRNSPTTANNPPNPTPNAAGGGEATSYTIVLASAQGNGVQVEMMWSQMGSKLILSSRLRIVPGEDHVRHTRVLTMQINWNMFGMGVAQVFPTTVLDAEDKPAEVSVVVACNNQKAPTPEIQVAIEFEFIGVRYVVAPPIPPPFLLLPATGCEAAFFVEQWDNLPYPVWTMPPQLRELKCDPTRLTTNVLRVYCLNLVHRREITEKNLVVLLLYCETIGHERLLAQATFNLKGNAMIGLTIRSTDAPVAAYVGEFIMSSLCPVSQD
ncbi:adaptin-related protein-like protein [Leptomonas pyrrhocoris]|uniref:Adaptin-related protein-like protein n=1 Tax=Leptomonas pyrrhocoris TaxID=157538 RepID=A0A0M9FVQ3_LEPPY|nr:adaptin-related protein-like protein [Leptomonas pyrrhocoris]KPA77060.1 adaptin-related protein-like protein [Leptomonas pyrrhocoris]|eukprot:XP_015655499.1 adaptin-related protein-like protein [Leptomonas pyrrhocoris]